MNTNARIINVDDVIRETFFPVDGGIRANMKLVLESTECQFLFSELLTKTWCYADTTTPSMLLERIVESVDIECTSPLDYEMLENVVYAIYSITRNCEDMEMNPELIKDVGQVSLEEYINMKMVSINHIDIQNLMLNLLDKIYRRTTPKRPVDVSQVLNKKQRLVWLLYRFNRFIINRDINTTPDYVAECDMETNGPASDPILNVFQNKTMLPDKMYTLNLTQEPLAINSDDESENNNDDFFDYQSRVHKISNRYCNHSLVKCPCMYSCRHVNTETPFAKHKGYKIDEESYRDLCAIISELPTCIVSDDPRKDYKNHFVVRIALTTADKNIYSACSRTKDEIMQKVNRLRSFYIDELPNGVRIQYEKFVAQDDGETSSLIDKMKAIFESIGTNLKAGILKVIDVVKRMVISVSEFISDKISQLVEMLFTKIAELVINQFDIDAFIKKRIIKLKDEVLTKGRKVAFFMIVIMFLIATEILGIFVFNFAAKIIFSITGIFRQSNECFDITNTELDHVSEGMGPISAVATMACAGFGLASGQSKLIKEKCDFLSSVLRAGSGISLLMGSVFVLLPTLFKDSIIMAWGSPEEKDAVLCEDWIIKSTCILRLSKIAKVLASPEMEKWIKEQLNEIPNLIKKIKTPGHRSMVLKIYSDLLRISTNLEQYHNSDNSRNVPYSIHLSAEPGFGKSLLAPVLINKAFDYAIADIYTRNQTEEYWSGYIAQPVVFVDEFLVNRDPQVVNRAADEYLKLISPSKFTPEFATTDNIIMGLKGTTVSPHIVVTANNSVYGSVTGYPKGAIDRRRRFVIEMIQNPARKELWNGKNSIDVSKMSTDDLNNAAWLLFNVKNNSRENPITLHLNMNFKSLVAFLRDDMKRYENDCKKMSEAFTSTQEIQEDPTEKLIAMMAEMKGAPRGTIDYDNPISGLFASATSFFAEGKKKNDKYFSPNSSDTDNKAGSSSLSNSNNLDIVTLESDYSSDNDTVVDQQHTLNRDRLTDPFCSNVDRTILHRHICLCCKRHKAIKSCEGAMYLRCVDCEKAKRRIPAESVVHMILNEPLIISEQEMEELREERIKNLKQLLAASRFTMIYDNSFPTTIWDEIGIGHDYYEFANKLGEQWKSRAKIFAVVISIYVGIMYIRRLLNKEARINEPATLTFIPESQSRRKETITKQINRYKATNWKGEGTSFTGLKYHLTIDGKPLSQQNGMPICPSKFITHRHSLIDENGKIYTHGKITVAYKDCIDSVPYSCNMIRELKINDAVSDFVMICLPPRMKINGFPNMLNKFWREEDFAKFNGGDVCIVQPDGSTATTRVAVQNHRNYSHQGNVFHISTALTYTGVGNGPGWCGLLLESYGNICPGMFIGMHVAGSGTKGRSDGLYGMGLPITREMLEQLINFNDESVVPETIDFTAEANEFHGAGLISCEMLPPRERVILSRVSKIRPSIIAPEMPEIPKKHQPLLSPNDPRAQNEDPLVNMINDTLSKLSPPCDEKRADRAVAGTIHHMRKNLTWIFPKRRLTFEEAVGGIPGLLTSMNRHTSAGYPLCKITKGQGKKEYFWFGEDGKLCYDPLFKDLVINFVEKFDCGECEKGRFVAYLKDELVSEKKINQRRCRIIYGGDMIANTAFRMIFGSFVIAYNHSYDKLSHVVGLNQYSYDMEIIHSYLIDVGTNFVAGDFKGWDKNMNSYIQRKVYYGIMQTCASLINSRNYESFYQHQVKSPVIVEKHLLSLENTQFSGCFFTTILNCLVHDAMLRYIFDLNCEKTNKILDFDVNVRAKILGDDHIYSFSDEAAVFMNPKTIQEAYKTIGAEYTDDLKDATVTDQFRKFEELTFLGAHPRIIEGKWVGALKKDTIDEMVLWTRNFNEDLLERCRTAIEMASLWGEEYYVQKASTINDALRCKNFPKIEVKPWLVMIHEVTNRTAANEATFPRYIAEGNEGLVNLNSKDVKSSDGLNMTTMMTNLRSKAVAEVSQDLSFGLESTVFRDSFEWSTTDIPGVAIKTVPVPFGLLELGDSDNVQNMPFDRFLYWNGDVKLTLQVNGTPFMCGMLAIYFMPLASYESELANISTTNHVYLQPDKNNTVEITIPFLYFRTVMNTVARTTESLGTIFVTPISPLSSIGGEPVTISLYSSFHNSVFSIPRPLPVVNRRPKRFYTVTGVQQSNDLTLPVNYIAEGASQSTNITNSYMNVGGTMPVSDITNTPTADLNFAPDISTDLKIPVGLDNPPLASGAIPVEMAYPGFSSSYGVRPTRDLQLMPATFARQQCMIFDPAETRIDVNCMRNCLMTTIPISTSMATNTTLVELSLDSRLNIGIGNNIPINLAVLNQFHFWRGDIEFTFVLVRTQYHSCRLQGVVAYGVDAIETGSRSVAYSNVMDFSGENSVCSMTIQFNAQTEFLRTYEGSNAVDPIQNHSLGTFGLFITNQLVAPETVPQTVDLLMYVRFLDVKVAVPRAFSPFTWNGYGELDANNKVDLTAVGVPQPLATNPFPEWTQGVYERGFIPIIVATASLFEPGQYTAKGLLNIVGKDTQAGISWTAQVTEVLVIQDGLNKRVGVRTDNTVPWRYTFSPNRLMFVRGPRGAVQWAGYLIDFADVVLSVYVPFEPTFLSEGAVENDIVEVDHVETSEITHDSEERPNVPHKVEPLAKFEFCPTDIVEIGRRYVRTQFVQNPGLDQTIEFSTLLTGSNELLYIQAATQLSSMWRGLFSAWAGSIKYRFFTKEDEFLEVMFQPFFNGGGQFGLSAGDLMSGALVDVKGKVLTADTSVVGPYAREMGYPSWRRQYVDVSVPFQSHFNFLFTSKTQEIAPISSGTITLSGVPTTEEIRVYSAFGDDLRLGVFRPPRQTKLSFAAYTDGINGYWV